MTSGGLSQEFEVFLAALDRAEPDRVAFLEERCGGNAALRDRVLDLLANHSLAEVAETTGPVARGMDPEIPKTIGPYTVRSRLGEGGMGVVYAAEQRRPIRRNVAVKLLKAGADSEEVLARFDAERQALALMNHANIARILDAGVHDGRPYFVTELIAGVPITDYCDRRGLSINDRLRLFLDICEGVQHAHQKGIIHRDLKPSNVLVTEEGSRAVPKIIDFGIAKAVSSHLLEANVYTEIGRIIGTPDYMSPEQADVSALDIDTRSDVYSLGALLYEMLCGETVFGLYDSKAGLDRIRSTILEKTPTRASDRLAASEDRPAIARARSVSPEALGRLLRQDLDWITQRALEKDRVRRYGSAADLANDIGAYLAGGTVVARPPSTGYRVRKFVRRNRGAVAAGLVLAGAIATASVTRVLAAVSAQQQRAEAEQRAADLEKIAAFEAERLAAIEPRAFGDSIREFILETADELDAEAIGARLESVNFTTVALRSIDRHVFDETIREIDERFAEDPGIRARLLQSAAVTMARLGLIEDAIDPQLRAIELRENTLGPNHPRTADSVSEHAGMLRMLGRFKESESRYTDALAVLSAERGTNDPSVIRMHRELGLLYQEMGRYDDALHAYGTALAGYRALHGDAHEDTAHVLTELGAVYYEMGEQDKALEVLGESVETNRALLDPDDPRLLTALTNYGGSLIQAGRLAEGTPYFEEALAGFRRVHGDDHQITMTMVSNMGYLKQELGAFDEAETLYTESLATRRRVLGADHADTLSSELNLANLYIERGTAELAEPLLLHAAETRERVLGATHPRTINAYNNLASLFRNAGRPADALALTEHAIRSTVPELPENHSLIGSVWREHAQTLHELGRNEEAVGAAERAHAARTATYGPDHPTVASAVRLVATIYDALERKHPGLGHGLTASEWRARLPTESVD